jgi:alkylation response protein AidB-like acyl-CoA dehydrogenase
MPYQPPLREYSFLLRELLGLERYANLPAFAEAPIGTIEQILEEGGRFAAEVLEPLNRVGDREGCRWGADFSVATPPGFKEAYAQYVEAGWPALSADAEFGGQGLPGVVGVAMKEMECSANMAFAMYPGLTRGAYAAIAHGGSPEQKALYLPKLASGQWAGTMNLTEPHCGTDLGLLRTKAVLQGDGSYRLSGQKIWISSGEQDLTENIVHLVLARIEGAPAGTK